MANFIDTGFASSTGQPLPGTKSPVPSPIIMPSNEQVTNIEFNTVTGALTDIKTVVTRTVSIMSYGADPSGGTDNSAAIAAALTALGTANPCVLHFPVGTYRLSVNKTIPANVSLAFDSSTISIDNGVTLTINGAVDAQPVQIFTYPSSPSAQPVVFGANGGPAQAAWFDASGFRAAWTTGSFPSTMRTVPNVAQLKTITPTAGQPVRVLGYATAGDGGGGVFHFNPNFPSADAAPTDPGFGVLVPTTVSGFTSGIWYREGCVITQNGTTLVTINGPLNARWFGAVGDGVTDDSTALNNALFAAFQYAQLQNFKALASAQATVTVYLPPGCYAIGTTLTMANSVNLIGEGLMSIIQPTSGNTTTLTLLRCAAANTRIAGINFVEGLNAIAMFGVTGTSYGTFSCIGFGTAPFNIDNCSFFYQKGPSIWQDCSGSGNDRTFQPHLQVTACTFRGSCLYWGSGDYVAFSDCNVNWDQTSVAVPTTADGLTLGLFNSGDSIYVTNCSLFPSSLNATRPCFFVGSGQITTTNCKTSDITGATWIRNKTTANTYTNGGGSAFGIPDAYLAVGSFQVDNCVLTSCSGAFWLELYQKFPARIIMRLSDDMTNFFNSYGVWVDSATISVDNIFQLDQRYVQTVNLEGGYFSPYAYAFRTGNDTARASAGAGNIGGTDITNAIACYFDMATDASDASPQDNLFLAGVTDASQLTVTSGSTSGTDSSSGYNLTKYTVLGGATSATWSGPAAGVYCMSFYVKATFSGRFQLSTGLAGNVAVRHFEAGSLQRLWYFFYYDGSNAMDFVFALLGSFGGGTIAFGMFMINAGRFPAPYVYPGNGSAGSLTLGRPASVFWGTAAPTGGTWKVGDIVYNTTPVAGTQIGWVCTAAGTPGTWKIFGQISA